MGEGDKREERRRQVLVSSSPPFCLLLHLPFPQPTHSSTCFSDVKYCIYYQNLVLSEILCHNTSEGVFCASCWASYTGAQVGLYLLNHIGKAKVAMKGTTADLHKLTLVFLNVQLQELFSHLSDAEVL